MFIKYIDNSKHSKYLDRYFSSNSRTIYNSVFSNYNLIFKQYDKLLTNLNYYLITYGTTTNIIYTGGENYDYKNKTW